MGMNPETAQPEDNPHGTSSAAGVQRTLENEPPPPSQVGASPQTFKCPTSGPTFVVNVGLASKPIPRSLDLLGWTRE